MSALLPIADFGTNYSGIGWITIVIPLVVLALVVAWWHLTWRRGRRSGDEQPAAPVVAKSKGKKSASHAVVPLLPAARLLPVGFAVALTLVVLVLWWHGMRRAQS
jgi:hypothetical protein